jgi:hypothetical protein
MLILTTGWCPFVGRLYELMETSVGAPPGVEAVHVRTCSSSTA